MKSAITINTEGEVKEVQLSNGDDNLAQLQEAVGGLVEAIDLTPNLTLWCNEEGKLRDLPINFSATLLWEKYFGQTDVILGNVILTGGTGKEGETLGLNKKTKQALQNWLKIWAPSLREIADAIERDGMIYNHVILVESERGTK